MSLTTKRAPRVLLVTLLAIFAATAVAACGSSSSSSSSSSSTSATAGSGSPAGSAQFSKYQSCLKSHGVTTTFHRPAGATGATGPRGHFAPPTGATGAHRHFTPPKGGFKAGAGAPGAGRGFFGGGKASKQDQAALEACAKDAPKGGFGTGFRRGPGGAGTGAQFSAATIKKFAACVKRHGYTLPTANTSGKGSIYPKKIEANKKFQTAATSCQSLLRPSAASGSRSSAGSSGGGA